MKILGISLSIILFQVLCVSRVGAGEVSLKKVIEFPDRMKLSSTIIKKSYIAITENNEFKIFSKKNLEFFSKDNIDKKKTIPFFKIIEPLDLECSSENMVCAVLSYEYVEFIVFIESQNMKAEFNSGYFINFDKDGKFPNFFFSAEFIPKTKFVLLSSRKKYGVYRVNFLERNKYVKFVPSSETSQKISNLMILKGTSLFAMMPSTGFDTTVNIVNLGDMTEYKSCDIKIRSIDDYISRKIASIEAFPSRNMLAVAGRYLHIVDYSDGKLISKVDIDGRMRMLQFEGDNFSAISGSPHDILGLVCVPQDSTLIILKRKELKYFIFSNTGELIDKVEIQDRNLREARKLYWSPTFKNILVNTKKEVYLPTITSNLDRCHPNCGPSGCKSPVSNALNEKYGCKDCKDFAVEGTSETCFFKDWTLVENIDLKPGAGFSGYNKITFKGTELKAVKYSNYTSSSDLDIPDSDPEIVKEKQEYKTRVIKFDKRKEVFLMKSEVFFLIMSFIIVTSILLIYFSFCVEETPKNETGDKKNKPVFQQPNNRNIERSSHRKFTQAEEDNFEDDHKRAAIKLEFDNDIDSLPKLKENITGKYVGEVNE